MRRWGLLLLTLFVSAQAFADPPSFSLCLGELRDCTPLLSEDGKTLALGGFDEREPGSRRVYVEFFNTEPPFAKQAQLTEAAKIDEVLRGRKFHTVPAPVISDAIYWRNGASSFIKADAFGLHFAIRKMVLTVTRDDKVLFRRQLGLPGSLCYEHSPYLIQVWYLPEQKLIATRSWGDKCLDTQTELQVGRLKSTPP